MAGYRYSTKNVTENMAKAVGISLPISTRHSVEICSFIRNRGLEKAKVILKRVIEKKSPVPFKKSGSAPHKKGVGPGRYPVNACKEILKLLNTVEANAQYKGLSGELKIVHICAQKAATPWHPGRKRRRKMKRTHVEVIVEETKKGESKKTVKRAKEEVKGQKKQEIKKTKQKKEKKTEEKEEIQNSVEKK